MNSTASTNSSSLPTRRRRRQYACALSGIVLAKIHSCQARFAAADASRWSRSRSRHGQQRKSHGCDHWDGEKPEHAFEGTSARARRYMSGAARSTVGGFPVLVTRDTGVPGPYPPNARAVHIAPWLRSGPWGRYRPRRPGNTAGSRQSSAFCGDSCVALVDGHHPGDVDWSSTEHGVLAAGDGASRRRQQSPEARRQGVSASGQLAPRPRWEQPTRCVSVWSQQAPGERSGERLFGTACYLVGFTSACLPRRRTAGRWRGTAGRPATPPGARTALPGRSDRGQRARRPRRRRPRPAR